MKRWSAFLLACAMLLSLCACGDVEKPAAEAVKPEQTQNAAETVSPALGTAPETVESASPSPEPIPAPETTLEPVPPPSPAPVADAPVEPMDFSVLLQEVSVRNKALFENPVSFDGFEDYLVNDTSLTNLLTDEEIQSLISSGERPKMVTYEQATHDVDVLFRALHSAYGAYYYFGEETFDKAKAEIMQCLDGSSVVSCADLLQAISRAFSFLRDAHAGVDERVYEDDIRWEYFYCTEQEYGKDDTGYYKYIGTEKWYFQSFSDDRIRMAPSLTQEGELVCAPVLFCPASEVRSSEVYLENVQGERKTQTLTWKQSEAFARANNTPDFHLLEESGIAYISVRSMNAKYADDELADFVASGAQVKDAELIIFDIRANGGGSDRFAYDWVENFSGERPSFPRVVGARSSFLRNAVLERDGYSLDRWDCGTFQYSVSQGVQLDNSVPIIVLVDDKCGSSGETMLNSLRSMENVLVVGSNSSGYQLCGNGMSFSLPNSNINFHFGSALQLWFSNENVDYKGYEPDVWCDPKDALESVLNMIESYELMEKTAVEAMYQAMDGVILDPQLITLKWNEILHEPGWDLRGGIGEYTIPVLVNRVRAEQFTVESSNTDVCVCTAAEGGKLVLSCVGAGESWITVTTGRNSARFLWVTEGE